MNGSFRVGNLFGIPFFINASWFLVLGLVTLDYGSFLAANFSDLGAGLPWILGLVTALLLFASVLAHELGHSFVALSQGIEVKSITLFLFGGLASLERESKTPAEAFWVAIAGPLVSIGLFGLLTGISLVAGFTGPLAAMVGLLAYINLVLALFNLIPGLPLDGGNILKSIVWKITNNPYKGIIFASRVGQAFGWLAIASGFLPIIFSAPPNFWNIIIGWFLLQNAGRSAQYGSVQDALAGLTAADAVTPDSPIVCATEELSVREFVNQYVIGKNTEWNRFLVTDDKGQLLGAIVVSDFNAIPTSQWPQVTVRELVKPVESLTTVPEKTSLLEVAMLLEQKQVMELTVVRDNGSLVGLIERDSIRRILERETQEKPA
jgi:Zn-dependent protease/CBS domain-containing protein